MVPLLANAGLVSQQLITQGFFGAEFLLVGVLPLRHADEGDRPDIGLDGPLEVHFLEQDLDGLIGRVAVREGMSELELPDPGFHGFRLARRTREKQHKQSDTQDVSFQHRLIPFLCGHLTFSKSPGRQDPSKNGSVGL